MLTSTVLGGTIWPKWMLKPCANISVAPSLRLGSTSFVYTIACVWSGTSIMTTSARLVASAAESTSKPAFSARAALGAPGTSLTTTVTPESRRFWACA
jgi:hypothetical protein